MLKGIKRNQPLSNVKQVTFNYVCRSFEKKGLQFGNHAILVIPGKVGIFLLLQK